MHSVNVLGFYKWLFLTKLLNCLTHVGSKDTFNFLYNRAAYFDLGLCFVLHKL